MKTWTKTFRLCPKTLTSCTFHFAFQSFRFFFCGDALKQSRNYYVLVDTEAHGQFKVDPYWSAALCSTDILIVACCSYRICRSCEENWGIVWKCLGVLIVKRCQQDAGGCGDSIQLKQNTFSHGMVEQHSIIRVFHLSSTAWTVNRFNGDRCGT